MPAPTGKSRLARRCCSKAYAQVCGDDETNLTEVINGVEVPIIDCRVHDRLTFRVPDDVPPGLYDFQVMVPNVAQVPGWGPVLFSNGERIAVVPPSTARFQIVTERLQCPEETAPESLGSDEVGIRILGVPLFPDLTSGAVQQPNGGKPIRLSDVDSGESRTMEHLLFASATDCGGYPLDHGLRDRWRGGVREADRRIQ